MRIIRPLLLHLLSALVALSSFSAHAFTVDDNYYDLSGHFHYFVDETASKSLEDILSPEGQQRFQSSETSKPERNGQEAAIWLKLELDFAESRLLSPYVISVLINNFDDIRIFRPNTLDEYGPPVITGNSYSASQREVDHFRYSFYIDPRAERQTIYIRSQGMMDTYKLPWVLVEKQLFEQSDKRFRIINSLSIGTLLGVIILCLCIGLVLPSKMYLVYSAFLLSGLISVSNQDGLAFVMLWPNHPEVNYYITDTLLLALSLTRLITIMLFLDLATQFPRLNYWCKMWVWFLAAALMMAASYGLKPVSEVFGGILWALTIVLGFGVVLFAVSHKVKLAGAFLIILIIPLIGSFIQAAVSIGLLGVSTLGLQSAKIAFVIHAILFSVCLARQIQIQIDSRLVAQHDGLTGLPRMELAKDFFIQSKQLADENNWHVGVLFIDLDGFKAVNDSYGHNTGDALLVEVARRIQSCLREVDTVARVGGDEFMVIQTEIKDAEANAVVAENIIQALTPPFIINQKTINISASVGIALYPRHGGLLKELMKQADTAMYEAKDAGKNQYCIANMDFNVAGKTP